ncbi:MAG: glycosyltransferase family 39 protein [bacterium]
MTSSSRALAAALLVALALQGLFWLLPVGVGLRAKALEPIADAAEYDALAASLVERGEFARENAGAVRPELFRTPVYPVLLAGLRAVFGGSIAAVLGLQLLLSWLVLLVTRRLAVELGLPGRAAALAALLAAASPNLAFLATKAVTETTFTLLLAVCLLLMARFRASGRPADLAGAGLAAGLLVLTRPIAVFWPVVISAWAGWRWLRARAGAPWHALVPLACALLVVGPWVARNHRVSGRAIVSTAAERNLFLYNAATVVAAAERTSLAGARDLMQAEARERFGELDSTDEAGYWVRLAAVGRDRLLRRPALAVAVQLAGLAANFLVPISVTPLLVHTGAPPAEASHVMQAAVGLAARGRLGEACRVVLEGRAAGAGPLFWCWFALAAVHLAVLLVSGLVVLRGPGRRAVGWLVLPVLYFTVLTGPVGEARFRAPVEPALALIAAGALARLGAKRNRGRAPGPTPE